MIIEDAVEENEIPADKADFLKRKAGVMMDETDADLKLDEVTHNCYVEVGEILIKLHRDMTELKKQAYIDCKKWLDDNHMPYTEEEETEETDGEKIQD